MASDSSTSEPEWESSEFSEVELDDSECEFEESEDNVVQPYRFEPYAESKEDEATTEERIPHDIDRLQNVQW